MMDRALPGDELLPAAALIMDRQARLPAAPEQVWPWLLQLGKGAPAGTCPAQSSGSSPGATARSATSTPATRASPSLTAFRTTAPMAGSRPERSIRRARWSGGPSAAATCASRGHSCWPRGQRIERSADPPADLAPHRKARARADAARRRADRPGDDQADDRGTARALARKLRCQGGARPAARES
jgi:hypothetical protein